MTGKLAPDRVGELITVIETICGDGTVLQPLVIYKGAQRYMGWYQHLDPDSAVGEYLFEISPKGWQVGNFDGDPSHYRDSVHFRDASI